VLGRVRNAVRHWKRELPVRLAARLLRREYERMRSALGGVPRPLIDQGVLRDLAAPFFDPRITGGEGHLEIGKTIYYSVEGLAHMVLSLKPFGCLPSTQSDGVQTAVAAHYARRGCDLNFVSVETSGEGDVGAYSRVQMALADARARSREEMAACVRRTGHSLDAIQRYCLDHRELRRPLQSVPRRNGIIGRASTFVLYVADHMDVIPDRMALAGDPHRKSALAISNDRERIGI
jgi:predicted nucleotide-binding protein (sugar kinase/HSP70/actin superfamily)